MIDENSFNKILESREDRAQKQIDILDKYSFSLISFTLNIPGIIKDNDIYRRIHKQGMEEILNILEVEKVDVKHLEEINKTTGSEGYISVDMNFIKLKKSMVDIENNHKLGRIFDIDVFDKDHNQMSRSDLGLESRRCLICEMDARVCMRNKSHSYNDLILKVEEISREYFR